MIPKVIHYCWFGGKPLPDDAKNYIESWRKHCPDYEIKEWNEKNFDITTNRYVTEAYRAKKWAFVSDYARFWILYNYGGIYFDTDVEVIQSIDKLVNKGPFMGLEFDANQESNTKISVAPGLGLAANPGLGLYKQFLDYYNNLSFFNTDGSYNLTTVVTHITEILIKNGLKNINGIQEVGGIYIYPKEYFSPMDYRTGLIKITENTYTIHHYSGSWLSLEQKKALDLRRYFSQHFGEKTGYIVERIYTLPKRVRCKIEKVGLEGAIRLAAKNIVEKLKK